MSRPLDSGDFRRSTHSDRRVASSTGRAVGAALACLLVTSVVVERSSAALNPQDAAAGTAFAAATIQLTDDDQGRALINVDNMVPGQDESSCINVVYEGTVLPAELTMAVEATGELAEFVQLTVTRGTDGSFEDCDRFEPVETLFTGTLAGLAGEPRSVLTLRRDNEVNSFRFDYSLEDTAAAIGKRTSADIVWETRPS